jgi:hypothetical protein
VVTRARRRRPWCPVGEAPLLRQPETGQLSARLHLPNRAARYLGAGRPARQASSRLDGNEAAAAPDQSWYRRGHGKVISLACLLAEDAVIRLTEATVKPGPHPSKGLAVYAPRRRLIDLQVVNASLAEVIAYLTAAIGVPAEEAAPGHARGPAGYQDGGAL